MKTANEYATELWQARQSGSFCELITDDLTLSQAYEIQNACNTLALQSDSLVGYKVGATSNETLSLVGLKEPFYGPLYKSTLSMNNGLQEQLELSLMTQHKPRIEAEFVVCIKNDINRAKSDLVLNDILDHIDWVAPGFEIVASRFSKSIEKPGKIVIADFGANQHMVVGEPYKQWRELDLTSHPVSLTIDNDAAIIGHSGMSILGNPLEFICWIANQATMSDTGLKAGQIVSCGTCTGAPFIHTGNQIQADYGALGKLDLKIID